jgi:hypothetical protein
MVLRLVLFISCLVAALVPLTENKKIGKISTTFITPPGVDLSNFTEVQLIDKEKLLETSFPGATKRFESANQQLIVRYIVEPSRKVHPAEMCFRAWGYKIVWRPGRGGKNGRSSCFEAEREGKRCLVCEQVIATDAESFPDVSAWYYQAILGRTKGPWWSLLEVQKLD